MMTKNNFPIAVAQVNPTLGDFEGNFKKVLEAVDKAANEGCELLILPQGALEGRPAGDWNKDAAFEKSACEVRNRLKQYLNDRQLSMTVVGGGAAGMQTGAQSALFVINKSSVNETKVDLDNLTKYEPLVKNFAGSKVGFVPAQVIEHKWFVAELKRLGIDLLVVLAYAPFVKAHSQTRRLNFARSCGAEDLALLYVNLVGGQDEAVFDGASFACDAKGSTFKRLARFEEDFAVIDFQEFFAPHAAKSLSAEPMPELYDALVLAVRDYVRKSGFTDVTLGLSGGVDSALVATIAVDALGSEHVHAVGMPTRFTSEKSISEAKKLAENLKISFVIRPIDALFESFMQVFAGDFKDLPWDETEENLQARIRGMMLMSYSNKFKRLVLTTGNKSESAAGYATLYGDTAGAFAVIKDVLKTDVWNLCRYVNQKAGFERIPSFIIERAPSAELREGQFDEGSLPPYKVLDEIVRRYVEEGQSVEEIVKAGVDAAIVRRVVTLIHRNEFKRRQCPLGPRVSARAFGSDWNYPVTSRFDPFEAVKNTQKC